MIAALFNIPTDPATLLQFSFHNRDQHELVADKIRRNTGVSIPLFPIDPIVINDFENWLYTHQAMHNSVNAALNVAGNDLTNVDPEKPEQLAAWIRLHASEHVQWGNILGIG